MYACETCPSEFSCGGLGTALKVAEAMPDLQARPALFAVVTDIRARLAAAGWDHLNAEHLCRYAGRDRDIQDLTARLIAELRASRLHVSADSSDVQEFPSLIAEEYSNE